MQIEVRFLGIYRDLAGGDIGTYNLCSDATVGMLIDHLVVKHPDLGRFKGDIRVLVDGRGAIRDHHLQPDAEIVLVDPISGG